MRACTRHLSHAYTYMFAFPGSVARTIALFEKHFCPEQTMNLSSDCRNNGDHKSPTKERSIPQAGRRAGEAESQRDFPPHRRILTITQSILRYYGRSIAFKNLVSSATRVRALPRYLSRYILQILPRASNLRWFATLRRVITLRQLSLYLSK